jgi:hypothetical protein
LSLANLMKSRNLLFRHGPVLEKGERVRTLRACLLHILLICWLGNQFCRERLWWVRWGMRGLVGEKRERPLFSQNSISPSSKSDELVVKNVVKTNKNNFFQLYKTTREYT